MLFSLNYGLVGRMNFGYFGIWNSRRISHSLRRFLCPRCYRRSKVSSNSIKKEMVSGDKFSNLH
jgi:hypothetical protein